MPKKIPIEVLFYFANWESFCKHCTLIATQRKVLKKWCIADSEFNFLHQLKIIQEVVSITSFAKKKNISKFHFFFKKRASKPTTTHRTTT